MYIGASPQCFTLIVEYPKKLYPSMLTLYIYGHSAHMYIYNCTLAKSALQPLANSLGVLFNLISGVSLYGEYIFTYVHLRNVIVN